MEKIRLNRLLARLGICSRRRADDLIKQGKVKVNGVIVRELGIKVDVDDEIVVSGKRVSAQEIKKGNFIYLAINKPIKVVTTLSDPQNRTTILDILPDNLKNKGLVPVGRLDYFSEGLLLISNDGDFVYKMTHPRFHLKKVYLVEVKGSVENKHLKIMKKGMELDGYRLAPVNVQIFKKISFNHFLLKFELIQGINRQIRRMCHKFEWKVLRLKRIKHGPIKLGNLSPGEYRYLKKEEIEICIDLMGLRPLKPPNKVNGFKK